MIDPNVRVDRIVNLDWLLGPNFALQWDDIEQLEDNIEWLADKMDLNPEDISEIEGGYPSELACAIENKKLRERMGVKDGENIWLVFVSAPKPAQEKPASITSDKEIVYSYNNCITSHEILILGSVSGDSIMEAAQEWRRKYLKSKGLI